MLDDLRAHGAALLEALERTEATLAALDAEPRLDAEQRLCNADLFLNLLGHTVIAWLLLDQARVACEALPSAAATDHDFYRGKIASARYFCVRELPRTATWAAIISSRDDTALATDDALLG